MKDFIPYQQALALKELGFDEPCFAYWDGDRIFIIDRNSKIIQKNSNYKNIFEGIISSPTFSQSFRWFREKHGYFTSPTQYDDDVIKKYDWHITKNLGNGKLLIHFVGYHNTYEEAELVCLIKLIEITKTK